MNSNKLKFLVDQDVEGVELMDAFFKSNKSAPHIHCEFAIGVMEKGVLEYTPKKISDKYFVKGHLPVINPGRIHSGENVDPKGTKYRMFYIQPEVLQKIANDIQQDEAGIPHFNQIAIKDAFLEQQLLRLHYCMFSNEYDAIQRQHYFYETFAYLLKKHSSNKPKENKQSPQKQKINRIVEYLHTNFDAKIQLQELAELAEMSTYYLNRVFSKHQGIPPHQYLINLRLNKARKLLKQKRSVCEVSYETGFFDQSHFTRNFKQFLGLTPKQYQLSF